MNLPVALSDIPVWVNWLAQDADGAWWGYSTEPLQFDQGWYENEVGDRIFIIRTENNPDWDSSLLKLGKR